MESKLKMDERPLDCKDNQKRLEDVRKFYRELSPEYPVVKGLTAKTALEFTLMKCDGRARQAVITLPHGPLETPAFMPVGTQGTIKSLTPDDTSKCGPQLILSNTYHLGCRPGTEVIEKAGGLHKFMGWNRNLLTDSGGFQMVSLLKLAEVTEEGVKFAHPDTGDALMLSPEESMRIQNVLGSDIMMALDDVVDAKFPDKERVAVAEERTVRWIDRCIKAHRKPQEQNLFGIIQGGLHEDLRLKNLKSMKERRDKLPGYAIGGLSGGESKKDFWPVVEICTRKDNEGGLPDDKPRYLMGVGHPLDIVICVAFGVDLFDCVYPTRTARFGTALYDGGTMRLHQKKYDDQDIPIDKDCPCYTCLNYSRKRLKMLVRKEPVGCQLLSIHNITYMFRLGERMRTAIRNGVYNEFLIDYIKGLYPLEMKKSPPSWVRDAVKKATDVDIGREGLWNYSEWANADAEEEEREKKFVQQEILREKAIEDKKRSQPDSKTSNQSENENPRKKARFAKT